jgi:FkbM family methyltransferase
MPRPDTDERLQQIHDAGEHPARFPTFVRLVRRALWPFIRPYHRRQIELGSDASGGDVAEVARDLAALRGEIRAVVNRMAVLETQKHPSPSDIFVANTPVGLMLLLAGDLISEAVASSGTWDAHLLPLFDEACGRGRGTAIDAGANVGFHTLAMASRFERVMSFEANPHVFRLLRANVSVNAYENVTCVLAPLYSREVEMALAGAPQQEIHVPWLSGESWTGPNRNLGALAFLPAGSDMFRGTARTVDSYDLGDLRLLKIDCQGADGEIILGAIETIRRCKPIVVFEWEDILAGRHSVSLEKVRDLLEQSGYEIVELYRHNEKQVDYVARPR